MTRKDIEDIIFEWMEENATTKEEAGIYAEDFKDRIDRVLTQITDDLED